MITINTKKSWIRVFISCWLQFITFLPFHQSWNMYYLKISNALLKFWWQMLLKMLKMSYLKFLCEISFAFVAFYSLIDLITKTTAILASLSLFCVDTVPPTFKFDPDFLILMLPNETGSNLVFVYKACLYIFIYNYAFSYHFYT